MKFKCKDFMVAKDLISDDTGCKTSDSGQTVSTGWKYSEFHICPSKQSGFSGADLRYRHLRYESAREPIGNHELTLLKPMSPDSTRLIGLAARLKLTVVPVLDDKMHYKGVITATDLVRYIAGISSMDQQGE